jgi:dephospho-CoA kinase
MPVIVGVLGGIGAGKSTVVRMLSELGATVVDADLEAHQVLETPAVREALRGWLGGEVFGADGRVDRGEVARRVFSSPRDLRRLEDMVHPPVLAALREKVEAFRRAAGEKDVLVLDVPLLAESPLRDLCDALLFVEASLAVRKRRVAGPAGSGRGGRGWAPEEIERRERFQLDLEEKKRLADRAIDNSGDLEDTRRQVRECYEDLLRRTSGGKRGGDDDGGEG